MPWKKNKRENPLFIYVSFGFVYKYQAQNCITSQNIHEKCCQLNRIFYSAVILIFQVNIQRKPSYLVTVNNKTEPVLEVEDQTTELWAWAKECSPYTSANAVWFCTVAWGLEEGLQTVHIRRYLLRHFEPAWALCCNGGSWSTFYEPKVFLASLVPAISSVQPYDLAENWPEK